MREMLMDVLKTININHNRKVLNLLLWEIEKLSIKSIVLSFF